MKSSRSGSVVALLSCLCSLVAGCKLEQREPEPSATAAPSAAGLPAPSTVAAPPATPSPATPNAATCPAGRWKYDYSDQALEVMMQGTAAAKVIKEEGEFVCEVGSGKAGTIVCATQGKPVVNVVETKQGGLPMTVSISIDGSATTKFELIDAGRMKVVASDTSALKVTASIRLGGSDVPFPAEKLVTLFGQPESTLAYKCEGGKLLLKPEIANVANTWQELTPAP